MSIDTERNTPEEMAEFDNPTEDQLRKAIVQAVEAPLRNTVSTSDIRVFGISSTKMGEIVYDIKKLISQQQLALLSRLEGKAAEYLDCQENPEQNWQNCTCDTANAIPLSVIQQERKKLQ